MRAAHLIQDSLSQPKFVPSPQKTVQLFLHNSLVSNTDHIPHVCVWQRATSMHYVWELRPKNITLYHHRIIFIDLSTAY